MRVPNYVRVLAISFGVFLGFGCVVLMMKTEANLGRLPRELHVSKTLYRHEKVFGLDPGGNETGFIVYALPEAAIKRVRSSGMAYVGQLNIKKGRFNWYQGWSETPVPTLGWCCTPKSVAVAAGVHSENYLSRWGFGIPIAKPLLEEVDEVLNNPGSFYTYGQGGSLLIIAPARKKVYLLYAG